jgi:hypothetical protein
MHFEHGSIDFPNEIAEHADQNAPQKSINFNAAPSWDTLCVKADPIGADCGMIHEVHDQVFR